MKMGLDDNENDNRTDWESNWGSLSLEASILTHTLIYSVTVYLIVITWKLTKLEEF